ncbi:MAG: Trk system potassium transporter TrkA [Pasteurellales bacterium]|nr:MAG: Trk system potassium transporter TrkA [Pasteurellales bacterium]
MKIIILGAGQVGSILAEHLSVEHEVTIIDERSDVLENLQSAHDLQSLQGNGSSPKILREAGANDADLLIAVTANDDTNMIACQIAYTLFHIPTRVARIRNRDYVREREALFNNQVLPIDHIILPEILLTHQITQLIEYPGALEMAHFGENQLSIVSLNAYYGGLLVGFPIAKLQEFLPHTQTKILSIVRGETVIIPQPSTVIEAEDEVFFISKTSDIKAVMSQLARLENLPKRIMIAGSTDISYNLAKALENQMNVKLIVKNHECAINFEEQLKKTLVLEGNAADKKLLFEEQIDAVDYFLALSDDDEANIMASLLAKKMGAKKTLAVVKRAVYLDLIQESTIDLIISPQQSAISSILSWVRQGDISQVASFNQGLLEALEITAHGDFDSSQVVGRHINELKLPQGVVIAGIIRNDNAIIVEDDTVIEKKDKVIIFFNDVKKIGDVEKLFQVSGDFI